MVTNLKLTAPDALLKRGEQVKEYDVEPPSVPHRGRPRTFSSRAVLLLAVVGVVLRTCNPQELCTLLTKEDSRRKRLGFPRVPHRRPVERRLNATLPEAEAQVAALGQQLLEEVRPEPDHPQAVAIDGRMSQAQGPLGHNRDRAQDRMPARLRHGDTESAWSKRGDRGWGQGYRWGLHGLVVPAPVPLLPRWGPTAVGASPVLAAALATAPLPVPAGVLGASTFGGTALVALYVQHGGWLLTPQQLPANPEAWQPALYA